jgi:hypothetical protein
MQSMRMARGVQVLPAMIAMPVSSCRCGDINQRLTI